MNHTKLNLGSGRKRMADALNLDLTSGTDPDVVHDLEQRPWPLPDNQFTEIYAYDVIEHLSDVCATMEEIHRISLPGALIHITVPHFSSANAYTDPTHLHYFGASSFSYFIEGHQFDFYSSCRFRLAARQVIFYPTLSSRVVSRLANRWPQGYERRWAWIFPAWYLFFKLEVIKDRVTDLGTLACGNVSK